MKSTALVLALLAGCATQQPMPYDKDAAECALEADRAVAPLMTLRTMGAAGAARAQVLLSCLRARGKA